MIRRLLLPALLLTLGACASEGPRGRGPDGEGGGEGGPRPPRAQLFISPSGEPFRGPDGLGRWLAQADTDHDGDVTLAEFRADALHSFKVLDTNGDGKIDGFEMQAYERNIVPEIGVMTFDEGPGPGGDRPRRSSGGGGAGGQPGSGRSGGASRGGGRDDSGNLEAKLAAAQANRVPAAGREGAARYSLLNEPEPIAAADANLDGNVTLAEWMAITDRRFAKLDHLKTGRLTRDSLLQIAPKAQPAPLKKP